MKITAENQGNAHIQIRSLLLMPLESDDPAGELDRQRQVLVLSAPPSAFVDSAPDLRARPPFDIGPVLCRAYKDSSGTIVVTCSGDVGEPVSYTISANSV